MMYNVSWFICFIIGVSAPYIKCEKIQYIKQPTWDSALNFKEIEEQLKSQPIIAVKEMRAYLKENQKKDSFQHAVYLVTLANGLKAVFKPASKQQSPYGEVAAYRASTWLGQRLVPPTVLREYQGQPGSLQFFVESPIDLFKPEERKHALSLLSNKAKSDMNIFYFVFRGRISAHWGNKLIAVDKESKGHVAIIDSSSLIKRKRRLLWNKILAKNKKEYSLLAQDPFVYSKQTLKRYKELSLKALHWIFKDALEHNVADCTPDFFNDILERKNQVLTAAHKVLVP